MEYGVFALQFFRVVFVGEPNLQVLFLSGHHTDHLLFKAGNKLMAADRQGLPAGCAAGKCDTVHGAGVIQVYRVPFLHCAVFHVDGPAGLLLVLGNPGIHHGIRQLLQVRFDLQALVVAQGHVGADKHFQVELQVLAAADFIQIDLGLAHRLQVVFVNSRTVRVREKQFKRVIKENALSIQPFDNLPGSLSLPESGHVDPLAQLQESLQQRFVKPLGRNGERQFRFVSGYLLVGVAHESLSS